MGDCGIIKELDANKKEITYFCGCKELFKEKPTKIKGGRVISDWIPCKAHIKGIGNIKF